MCTGLVLPEAFLPAVDGCPQPMSSRGHPSVRVSIPLSHEDLGQIGSEPMPTTSLPLGDTYRAYFQTVTFLGPGS